jgi:hypothetical protein
MLNWVNAKMGLGGWEDGEMLKWVNAGMGNGKLLFG